MKELNYKFKIISFFICILFSNCKLFANEKIPYLINGEMVLDSSSKYEAAGFDFCFINKSEKNIKSFTIVFYVFDEDGNPPLMGRNNIVITVNSIVLAKESLENCVSMDSFLYEIPEEPYEIDYLYVSRIVYEDDSVWTDPFGLYSF